MLHTQRGFSGLAIATVFLFGLLGQVHGLLISYCSTLNTGSGGGNFSEFQSNGLCRVFCVERNYALAIVQSNDCWCSDYIPGPTESVNNCASPCPGYGPDTCGGKDTFGYIVVGNPSGTDGGSAASSTAANSSPASDSSSSSSSTETQPSPTNPPSASSTWTPTPSISLQTVTGQVHTVTVTPTAPPSSQNDSGTTTKKSSGGLGTGGAVGLAVGLVALAALVGGIIYFCWRKRKQGADRDDASRDSAKSGLSGPIPSRTMSEHSRFVLGTDGTRVVETWEPVEPTPTSGFMPVDPRLDPFAPVYQRGEGSKSRESVNTIQDDRDYSRRVHQPGGGRILRTTNPD